MNPIDPKELHVGSLVWHKTEYVIGEVVIIAPKSLKIKYFEQADEESEILAGVNYDDIEPLEVHQSYLILLGWEEKKDLSGHSYYTHPSVAHKDRWNIEHFILVESHDGIWYLDISKFALALEVKNIHHLQSLIYGIDGQWLAIKKNDDCY